MSGVCHQEHRVDRSQLAKERDGFGTLRAKVEQRAASGQRSGEPDRLDQRMLDQRMTHVAAVAMDYRKDTRMNAAFCDCSMDRFGDDFGRAGMGGVALDHNRAACGEGGGSVTAGGRKRERKVGGAEDGNRADGALDHADVGTGQRLPVGHGLVHPEVEMVALANVTGKKPQLSGGAPALALQARGGKAGFARADVGDRIGAGLNLVRDGVKEIGPFGAAGIAVSPERCLRRFAGGIDLRGRADLKLIAAAGGESVGEGLSAADPFACDQVLAVGFK